MDNVNWIKIADGSPAYVAYYLEYEPGNGSRYEIIVAKAPRSGGLGGTKTVLSLVNFRTCMEWVHDPHESYVQEKLNLLPGDALAICALMRDHSPC